MLHHELLRDQGILLVRPQGPIQAGDFESGAKVVDPYIEEKGKLRGVMVEAQSFPGWDTFAALLSHLRFVRDHHQRISKIAAVSDSTILSILPQLAKHFVKADVRHFNTTDRDAALAWLRESDGPSSPHGAKAQRSPDGRRSAAAAGWEGRGLT